MIDFRKIETWPTALNKAFIHEDMDGIFESLVGQSLRAWHCTKLISPNQILSKGLKILNSNMYQAIIMSELQKHFSSVDFDKYVKAHDDFIANEYYECREQMLWFIFNKEMAINENGGCHDFFKFYGGEVTRRIVEFELPDLMHILNEIGKPYLIEFEIGFDELPEHRKILIPHHFLEWKRIKESLDVDPIFESEAYVEFDIPKEKIVQIIPFRF